MKKFPNKEIKLKYNSYSPKVRNKLLELRELIFETAAKTKEVGTLEECLKWNEPSFLTSETKSGSTIRIDWKEKDPHRYHLYVNCQTQLISIFKEIYPLEFEYTGNRCVSFDINKKMPKRKVSKLIQIALTYKINNYKDLL